MVKHIIHQILFHIQNALDLRPHHQLLSPEHLLKHVDSIINSGFANLGKASAYNEGDPGSILGSGRSPGEGNGNPLQYSCLENPMDGGAW